jgi:divalent metal cation (Fe/Co/Zn/Cd) transporter
MDALAEDHLNDVMSNGVALVTASIAFRYENWWVDPAGAILISAIIIYRWYDIILDQVKVWIRNKRLLSMVTFLT